MNQDDNKSTRYACLIANQTKEQYNRKFRSPPHFPGKDKNCMENAFASTQECYFPIFYFLFCYHLGERSQMATSIQHPLFTALFYWHNPYYTQQLSSKTGYCLTLNTLHYYQTLVRVWKCNKQATFPLEKAGLVFIFLRTRSRIRQADRRKRGL